jgi:exosortase
LRQTSEQLTRQTFWFALYGAGCVALFWRPLGNLVRLSLLSDTSSHIALIPFIALCLVWINRRQIFRNTRADTGTKMFAAFLLLGGLLYWLDRRFGASLSTSDSLGLLVLSMLCLLWAGFALIYGARTFRAGLFPLLFLLLMVPLPEFFLDRFIWWLQLGSAEVTSWMFHLTGTPVLREGLLFTVPGVTIEIAKECSGIRSTLALLITCLLAGYFFFRTAWARLALLTAALPMLILKNGIRITTLTLLAIHVDPGFLFGRLHRDGGFIFFAIGLFVLVPVLLWLQKTEHEFQRSRKLSPEGRAVPITSSPKPVRTRCRITRWRWEPRLRK